MGALFYLVGLGIALLCGAQLVLAWPLARSAPQEAVLYLMLLATEFGILIAGLGVVIHLLRDIRDRDRES